MQNLTPEALERARRLRKSMSVSEKWVWEWVRKDRLGFRFRRQFPVGPYILDFYCVEAKFAIEVDGEQHVNRREKDVKRDEFLAAQGVYVLRIPSQDIFDPEGGVTRLRWQESIQMSLCERTGRPVSSNIKFTESF